MKLLTLGLATAAIATFSVRAQETSKDETTTSKNQETKEFQSVINELDMNGNFLMVMNAKQIQERISGAFTRAQNAFAGNERRRLRKWGTIATSLKLFYNEFGLNELTALGMSSVTVEPHAFRNKVVIRTTSNAKGIAWNIVGKSTPMESMALLPVTTQLATATNLDLAYAWEWMQTQRKESGPLESAINQVCKLLESQEDMSEFLKGFDGHAGICVLTNDAKTITIPLKRKVSVTIPSPGLAVFTKVTDRQMMDLFELQAKRMKLPSQDVTLHGVSVKKYIPRYTGPLEFTPMVAMHKGYVIITTNEDTMTSILAVATGKEKGLSTTDEFKKMAGSIKPIGNSYHFVSPKLTDVTLPLLQAIPNTIYSSDRSFFKFLLGGLTPKSTYWSYGVTKRQVNGFHIEVNSSESSGAGTLLQFAGAPLAIAAGVALPTLSKARVKAQRANSGGNLKQMGLALLMYSGDYSGVFPKKDGIAGLNILVKSDYLHVTKVYVNPRDSKRVTAFEAGANALTDANCSYAYIGGGLRDDNVHSSHMPLVWEKPHEDAWTNVLFVDGHVSGFSGAFNTNVDIVNGMKKRGLVNAATYTYALKKAMILDNALGVEPDKLSKEMIKQLDSLVKQLGDESYKVRRKAQADLQKYLPKAFQYLRLTLKETTDPEVKSRIKKILSL